MGQEERHAEEETKKGVGENVWEDKRNTLPGTLRSQTEESTATEDEKRGKYRDNHENAISTEDDDSDSDGGRPSGRRDEASTESSRSIAERCVDVMFSLHHVYHHFYSGRLRAWRMKLRDGRSRSLRPWEDHSAYMTRRYEKLLKMADDVDFSRNHVLSASNQLYEYEPLPSATSIRLIRLTADNYDAPINCTISTHNIKDCPEFEALSYCWGDHSRKGSILCTGMSIHVSQNLWYALRRLRQPENERVLWIDALCIDQRDVHERGAQVQLMTEIYSKATRVVISLGERTRTSTRGMLLIRRIGESCSNGDSDVFRPWLTRSPLSDADLVAAGLPEGKDPDWRALDALYWRAWFSRVWVIQELKVAKSAIVICGPDDVKWDDFMSTASWIIYRHVTRLPKNRIDPRNGLLLDSYRRTTFEQTLLDLLNRSRSSLASDPRDKVYSLLGISSDSGSLALTPDYTKSAAELFRDTARLCLQRGSLDILSSVGDSRWSSQAVCRLPSWAPDWSSSPRAAPFLVYSRASSHMRAGGVGQAQPRFSTDLNVMYSTGLVFDHVCKAGPAQRIVHMKMQNNLTTRVDALLNYNMHNVLRLWESIALHPKRYPTGETSLDAFQRTLIANVPLGGDGSLHSLDDSYRAFRLRYMHYGMKGLAEHNRTAADVYARAASDASVERRFFVTKKGYMGLGSFSTRPGDTIAVLLGGKTPYVLRESGRERYKLVGECYVHGVMNGEALAEAEQLTEIAIV